MLTIELEPEGGKAIIKHYTTTGQSLNGISGFTDREEVLIKNSAYSFTHTSGNTTYEYQGFKKVQSLPLAEVPLKRVIRMDSHMMEATQYIICPSITK